MTINLDVRWYQSKYLKPPKSEWVLMLHNGYSSVGRNLGSDWYEFFDIYTGELITIPTPKSWARLPKKTSDENRGVFKRSEDIPQLF